MTRPVLGRTNRAFPAAWLRLVSSGGAERHPQLVEAALAARTVLDISSAPALWGGSMRGTDATLMGRGGLDVETAVDEAQAADLVQAHLIETLSSIGRETLDFYFLRVRRAWEEFQISGALQALESARQDGHVRYVGLQAEGPAMAALSVWQFHDAFEVLLVESEAAYRVLRPMALERRVGLVVAGERPAWIDSEEPSLVAVQDADEVERLCGSPEAV